VLTIANGRPLERALRSLAHDERTKAIERIARRVGGVWEPSGVLMDCVPVNRFSDIALKPRGRPVSPVLIPDQHEWRTLGLAPLDYVQTRSQSETSRLLRSDMRLFMPSALAPPVDVDCPDRQFAYRFEDERFDPNMRNILFGLNHAARESPDQCERFEQTYPVISPAGALGATPRDQLPLSPLQVPQLHKLILDSGKLAKLDSLLQELKAGGHRVLVYFQMTRMIDLMEEYLAFRQYKYLRLDGGSSISERRDMVMDWQTRPDLFIFLLSTRAGGLGINLTAADTVIFYDSDWNPSVSLAAAELRAGTRELRPVFLFFQNDSQAMDRAHRLGQTKQVTVYRLITKDTIDERIVQLAR
jgi:DNA helicase INO80